MEIAIPSPVAGALLRCVRRPQRAGRRRGTAVPHRTGRSRCGCRSGCCPHRSDGAAPRHRRRDDARPAGGDRGVRPRVRRRCVHGRALARRGAERLGARRAGAADPRRLRRPRLDRTGASRFRDAESDDGRGPREHFHTFLRSLDVEHEGLPGWYADRLLRALHHYGVTELQQGPQLEAALLRLFISQQRQDEQIPVVLALVDDLATKASDGDPRLRETLDRLIEATRRRFPVVAAGARAVRHRRFDRPYVERRPCRGHHRDAPAGRQRRRPPAGGGRPRRRRRARRLPAAARADSRPGPAAVRDRRAGGAARGVDPPLLQDPRAGVSDGRRGRCAAHETTSATTARCTSSPSRAPGLAASPTHSPPSARAAASVEPPDTRSLTCSCRWRAVSPKRCPPSSPPHSPLPIFRAPCGEWRSWPPTPPP